MAMHDPMWMRGLLGVHVLAGATAFLMAPVALATAKGGKAHRRWGKVYLWAMGIVAATALPMALYRPVLFLALVAVFSFYACFSAWRVLALKDLSRGGSRAASSATRARPTASTAATCGRATCNSCSPTPRPARARLRWCARDRSARSYPPSPRRAG